MLIDEDTYGPVLPEEVPELLAYYAGELDEGAVMSDNMSGSNPQVDKQVIIETTKIQSNQEAMELTSAEQTSTHLSVAEQIARRQSGLAPSQLNEQRIPIYGDKATATNETRPLLGDWHIMMRY